MSGAVTSGRFVALAPQRVLDTRDGTGTAAGARPGSATSLALAGVGGVPAGSGASVVVLSVTITDVTVAGFLTVHPGDDALPVASNINVGPGGTRSNLVLAPLAPDGSVQVYTQAAGHVVADVLGYVTGASAPSSTAGLLVPLDAPVRLLDTRDGAGGVGRLASGQGVALRIGGRAGIPVNVAAVTGNLTVVDPVRAGFASIWPGAGEWPGSSNVNIEQRGQMVPSAFAVGAVDGRLTYGRACRRT